MPPEAARLLEAAGIDAGYGTMQVLWGVDLDVRAGETVLLLGANGAGKTTLLKSLVGLIEARQRQHQARRRGRHADAHQRPDAARHDLHVGTRGVSRSVDRGEHPHRRPGARPCRSRRPGRGAVWPVSGAARQAPRAGVQPVGRPAQDARHRQGAGGRAAAAGDGRALGRAVAAVRQGGASASSAICASAAWRC